MTAAQEWMLEGMEKGREEGLAQGLETGLAQGLETGLAQGREEGERAALSTTLTRLVRLRFRDVPEDIAARVDTATKAELERWIERILTAESLADVVA